MSKHLAVFGLSLIGSGFCLWGHGNLGFERCTRLRELEKASQLMSSRFPQDASIRDVSRYPNGIHTDSEARNFLLRETNLNSYDMGQFGRKKAVLANGILVTCEGNLGIVQCNRESCLIQKFDGNMNDFRGGAVRSKLCLPIGEVDPLRKGLLLKANAISGFLYCAAADDRLPDQYRQRQEGTQDQPPFGPFDGCVPIKRVCFGASGMILGSLVWIIAILKSRNRLAEWGILLGAILFGAGSLIWLTGHERCEDVQQQSSSYETHDLGEYHRLVITNHFSQV